MKRLSGLWMVMAALATQPAITALCQEVDFSGRGPFWPGRETAKFTTPQWIGEDGVEAALILSIDDLRDPDAYEAFVRPLLDRLKRIDGRAPLSMMTMNVPPDHARLQSWLGEGVQLETHTLDHPCPLLGSKGPDAARKTYLGAIDTVAAIPGADPVAFRMPCCDSMNSASPRFFAEIFGETSPGGRRLAVDSSVLNLFTGDDPSLPGELVFDAQKRPRFLKYLPSEPRPGRKLLLGKHAASVENYPYPYIVGDTCWEFPIAAPSDWNAFNYHVIAKSPELTEDWKAALDATVIRQGVMVLCFHGHGWCSAEQLIALVDHAQTRYGKRVKILSFKEALRRIESHALGGRSLRLPESGQAASVRLVDMDADGFMDVLIGGEHPMLRRWDGVTHRWTESSLSAAAGRSGVVRFKDGARALLTAGGSAPEAWIWRDGKWVEEKALARGFPSGVGRSQFVDVDGDGQDDCLAEIDGAVAIWQFDGAKARWHRADFALPDGVRPWDDGGKDAGLRFVDLNGDGLLDVLFSNKDEVVIALWSKTVAPHLGWTKGWSQVVRRIRRSEPTAAVLPPPIVADGQNRGFWIKGRRAFWQNESTATNEAASTVIDFADLIAYEMPGPRTAGESAKVFQISGPARVELVAAEPLIRDPIAVDWDEKGRLWALEMRDYPLGVDGKDAPGGSLKCLEDTDGDGRVDRAVPFLEGLSYPSGIARWRDGWIVATAPDLLFARDSDGDGRADETRVLFTGFTLGNQQHRVNGFVWGGDGWLYGANGDSGGTVSAVATASGRPPVEQPPVNIRGRDFRFDPDTGRFETISGATQYGLRKDDAGHWFGNNNPNWLWHVHTPEHYLKRNPGLIVRSVIEPLANDSIEPNRVHFVGPLLQRFNQPDTAGRVTSACSPEPYRDTLLPAGAYICEPVHNVVHREVLSARGSGLQSHRAPGEEQREFLASADRWCRPVCAKTGPDGALYIADMYRAVLEHPEWISAEDQARVNLRAGDDLGRIWRLVPADGSLRSVPDFSKATPLQIAEALDTPNGPVRDVAGRLLHEKSSALEESSVAALRRIAVTGTHAQGRAEAVAALDLAERMDVATVLKALADADAWVRRRAAQAAERMTGADPPVLPAVTALANDDDAEVRRQAAFSLGAWMRDDRLPLLADEALLQIAARDGGDPLTRIAIVSSVNKSHPLMKMLETAGPGQGSALPLPPLAVKPDPERGKVAARYAPAAQLSGDAGHGREKFAVTCALCHRHGDLGRDIGPPLGMVAAKPWDWLLTAIFDPNAAVEVRYQTWHIVLRDGSEKIGLLSAETANNLVLRLADGSEALIQRDSLQSVTPLHRSLMPEGLEAALSPQDVADIVAWLKK